MKRFKETNGVLEHENRCPESIAQIQREVMLFDQVVDLDHFVVTLQDSAELLEYKDELLRLGGEIIEGPGLWPNDFCENSAFPDDLSMNFASVLLKTGVIAVLASPHTPNDQLDRFLAERGSNAIHHVAINITDFQRAQLGWLKRSFTPLSRLLDDKTLAQQFLRNRQGQILELIRRFAQNQVTFTCDNLKGLRQSEGEQR